MVASVGDVTVAIGCVAMVVAFMTPSPKKKLYEDNHSDGMHPCNQLPIGKTKHTRHAGPRGEGERADA